MGEGTLARKLPYSVADNWSFRSSAQHVRIDARLWFWKCTECLALGQVDVVLGIEEADAEAADEAFDVTMLSVEQQHP
jgi:hypothetical protein